MGWLRLVGSIKLQVSFAKEPYKRDDILQKRPIILSILLTVATPYSGITRPVTNMGWLRLVGSIKLQVSFAKEPYKRADILQKRPIILSILLTVATPYSDTRGIYSIASLYTIIPIHASDHFDMGWLRLVGSLEL